MSEQVNSAQAVEILKGSHKILVAPSAPVDGDSIGSALALLVVLRKMGKDVRVVVTEQLPEALKFLPHVDQIEHSLGGSKDFVITLDTNKADVDHMKYEVEQGKINIIITPKEGKFTPHDISFSKSIPDFDLIITVDTGDLVQLGKLREENPELFAKTPLLNIDHHASNGRFGTANFLDFSVASTTQMLFPVLKALEDFKGEKLIDEDVATLLLTGLVTDTGSFQHSNTSPQAFETAADLLDLGARQQEIIKHIFKTKSLATLKLWGRVLSKIQYDDSHRFVYSTITEQDLQDTGAHHDDSGGIIDELMSNAPRAEVVLLLKEKSDGLTSGSLRATGSLADVSEIAGRMGGGGHIKAAGFRIKGKSFDEALQEAKSVIEGYMAEKLGTTQATAIESQGERLFPNLVTKPMKTIPAPSAGGEDMLLENFRKQNKSPEEKALEEKSAPFFQDKDGQMTVEDVLAESAKN